MTARPSRGERVLDRIPFLEKELLLLRRLVRPGDVCLDIGAAGGAHLMVMARRAGRRGRVLGVEARPRSAVALSLLTALVPGGARPRIHQVALADDAGVLTLRIPLVPTRAHLPGTATDRLEAAAFAGLPATTVTVPSMRLDDLIAREGLAHVDVVKLDVEGAESAVLAGAPYLLHEQRPVFVIEADDLHQRRFDTTAADLVAGVVAAGYRAHRFLRGGLTAVDRVTADEDDYVLIPDERRREVLARVGPSRG